jgi:hypothetical protein
MSEYEECPICDRLFEADAYNGLVHTRPVEAHIRTVHHMVKVRRGSNYRWIPETEVKERLAADRKAANPRATRA